ISIGAASIALAWLSTRYVEDIVRSSPRLLAGRRPRTIGAWSAVGMACVLVVSLGTTSVQGASAQRTEEATEQLVAEQPDCFGAEAVDPDLTPWDDPELAGGPLGPPRPHSERDDARDAERGPGPDR